MTIRTCHSVIVAIFVQFAVEASMCGLLQGLHHRHIQSSLHSVLVCNKFTYGAGHVMAVCRKACKIVAVPLPDWHLAPQCFKDESMAT